MRHLPLFSCDSFREGLLLLAGSSLLRGLERVGLGFVDFDLDFAVRCEVAELQVIGPLETRCRGDSADLADGAFGDALTARALFNHGLTGIGLIDTPLF